MLDESVITKITTTVENLGKKIMVWSVIHDYVGEIMALHYTVKGDDSWVPRSELVKCDFTDVDLPRARVLNRGSNQTLDCIRLRRHRSRPSVDCAIDYTVTTDTQDLHELEGAPVNKCPDRRMNWRELEVALGRHDD